jgi:hypothetical protein
MAPKTKTKTMSSALVAVGQGMIARKSNDENGCFVDEVFVELAISERRRECVEGRVGKAEVRDRRRLR